MQGYQGNGGELEFQRVARPPTVIGGGGAGAIDVGLRQRANAEEESMRAAAAVAVQRETQQLDINAEAQFPGLGPNAAPAALMHRGWVGGAASRQVMNASFPTLNEATMSRGQKKKMKAKAKRETNGAFGSTNDLPPAEIMAMGVGDAAGRDSDNEGAGPSMSGTGWSSPARTASPAAGQPPGLARSAAAGQAVPSARGAQPPVQNAFARLAVDEPAPDRVASPARTLARPAAAAAPQADFPSLGGAGAAASRAPKMGGWVSVGDKKAPAPVPAPRQPALTSRSAFPALQGGPIGGPSKAQTLEQANKDLFKKMQVRGSALSATWPAGFCPTGLLRRTSGVLQAVHPLSVFTGSKQRTTAYDTALMFRGCHRLFLCDVSAQI